ncbi:MAG: Ig-like domain-containing protein, partial [Sulfurovaceae bacterium]
TGSSATDLITSDGTLTVTPNEAGNTIEYSTDGGSTWSTTAPTATEGSNTVTVREIDTAGNPSAPASITFTLDTTAPVVDVNDIALTNDDTPELTGTIDDPTATVTVTVDGVDYTATNNGDGTWTLADDVVASLADGTTTVDVSATDTAGNTGTGSGSVTVDATAPDEITLLSQCMEQARKLVTLLPYMTKMIIWWQQQLYNQMEHGV